MGKSKDPFKPLTDGLKNAKKAIETAKAKTAEAFNQIKELFKKLKDLENMFKCPKLIFSNLPTCGWYWLLDLLFYIVWFVGWWFCFIFFFCPVWGLFYVLNNGLKTFLTFFGVYPLTISINDICPSKQGVMLTFEKIYRLFSNERFLYRDNQDIKKCYCLPPLKLVFQPLMKYKELELSDIPTPSLGNVLVFPFLILLLMVIIHKLEIITNIVEIITSDGMMNAVGMMTKIPSADKYMIPDSSSGGEGDYSSGGEADFQMTQNPMAEM